MGWDEKLTACKHLYFKPAAVPRSNIKLEVIFLTKRQYFFLLYPCVFTLVLRLSLGACLAWIPSHIGIKGNHEASTLAKEATKTKTHNTPKENGKQFRIYSQTINYMNIS